MENIIILDVKYCFFNNEGVIHPAVLKDGSGMALGDCGHMGDLAQIEAAFRSAGLDISELTAVIATHHDHDHMGALAALKRKYSAIYRSSRAAPKRRTSQESSPPCASFKSRSFSVRCRMSKKRSVLRLSTC